ncbi:dihydropteroate synthase [Leptolyngbya sp. FACHB-17]|uniref:dihydropteroate synthase n=1 Tax=unclassified Leptolyngbya TaxID=2650499 RepID=UPI001681A57D|nr:dihydropteroate synthase [Leptolyngbya sp. FACHB-17]MBD2081459.1 dihydropteroate synthase [Leptolyngbya sp. FACHB-17]
MQAWELSRTTLSWGQKTYIMGVLNVTPDSFSDGGQFNSLQSAITQAEQMVKDGVDILDIGGQSTRPNADEVSLQEELDRVLPIIEAIRQRFETPISVDTTRSQVAKAAIAVGADMINDISGAVFDAEMLTVVGKLGVPIILMHMRGTPKTMQSLTEYDNLIQEICDFLQERIQSAIAQGINQIMIDPGIGFAKKYDQNLEILRRLQDFKSLNCPILVGASRKSFIGQILDQPDPKQRVWGTAAACVSAIANGADVVRVHDVAEMRDACHVADAIWRNS